MTAGQGTTRTISTGGDGTIRQKPIPGLLLLWTEAEITGDGIYPFQAEVSIGRGPDCVIFLEDPGLSRSHAVIRQERGKVTVLDRGSHNGTFIHGRRIRGEEVLPGGGLVRCGQSLLASVPDTRPYRGWRSWGPEGPLVGGPEIRQLKEEIRTFATSGLEVLILGDSGTGKELVAREVHRQSERNGPLVAANCAALPEAELFGAMRGAFTGADRDRDGLMRAAHGGTLFLDEVTELPPSLQAKLLRVVEQQEVRPLGGSRSFPVDTRLVAATNRSMAAEVQRGSFRADLYHRLRGAEIRLPPLRERRNDIALLASHLASGGPAPSVVAMERLLLHSWPGNVRELDRALREAAARAAARGAERILPEHLRADILPGGANDDEETARLSRAMKACGGNVAHAAQQLGVSRAQVYKLLKQRGLDASDFRS